jgi:hypothetical protein
VLVCSGHWLAFKALLAAGPKAAGLSLNTTAKGLASGSYTFYQETAACAATEASCVGVGQTSTRVTAATIQACLDICDRDGECAGASVTGVPALWAGALPAATIVTCHLVKGDGSPGTGKRSVTKTVVTRLAKGGC